MKLTQAWRKHLKARGVGVPEAPHKFGAKRSTDTHGRLFASAAERDRAEELRLLEQAGAIQGLVFQPVVRLADAVNYRADFAYTERGRLVHEDVKGVTSERFRTVCNLWRVHGPSLLRITKRSGKRRAFVVAREIMPKGVAA